MLYFLPHSHLLEGEERNIKVLVSFEFHSLPAMISETRTNSTIPNTDETGLLAAQCYGWRGLGSVTATSSYLGGCRHGPLGRRKHAFLMVHLVFIVSENTVNSVLPYLSIDDNTFVTLTECKETVASRCITYSSAVVLSDDGSTPHGIQCYAPVRALSTLMMTTHMNWSRVQRACRDYGCRGRS
jgi:hypothetical protein